MTEKKAKYKAGQIQRLPEIRFTLESILRERGINLGAAAVMIGISTPTLYHLLRMPKAIRLDTLGKICNSLEVQPGDLFELN